MASPLLTKYVEFKAKGLGDLRRETKQYKQAAADAAAMTDKFRRSVESGQWARQTRELAAARRELEGFARAYRQVELQARFGRLLGGGLALGERLAGSPLGRGLGYAGLAGAGAVVAGARSGFGGTLEGNRLEYQMKLLNHELAGAFVPAIRKLTDVIEQGRRFVQQNVGPTGQDALAGGALAVLGGFGLHKASTALGGPGLGTMLARGGGLVGRGGSAAAGFGSLSSAGGGVTSLGSGVVGTLSAAAGAHAMYSLLNREGKDKVAGKLSPFGPKTTGMLQAISEFLPSAGNMARLFDPESRSGPRSLPKWVGDKLKDAFGGGLGDKIVPKSKVTLAGGGFEAPGSAYYRVAEAYAMTGDTEREKQIAASQTLLEAAKLMAEVLGKMAADQKKQAMR